VHSVFENFVLEPGPRAGEARDTRPPPIVATNVYLRGASGWRMIVHHASPAPGQPEPPPARDAPKIFH
jgi:hypothetical protein